MYMLMGLNVYWYRLYRIQSLGSNWHEHIITHNELQINTNKHTLYNTAKPPSHVLFYPSHELVNYGNFSSASALANVQLNQFEN